MGFIGRAELPLRRPDGSRVDVHFYEAYWAPLTEGRVTLRETLTFFIEAGFRGLRFALIDGVFDVGCSAGDRSSRFRRAECSSSGSPSGCSAS
jgi:hypothetical protein